MNDESGPFLQDAILKKRSGFKFSSQVPRPSSQNTRRRILRAFCKGRVLLFATTSQKWCDRDFLPKWKWVLNFRPVHQTVGSWRRRCHEHYLMILFCPKAPRPGQAGTLLGFRMLSLGGRYRIPAEISPCSDWNDLAPHPSALFSELVIPKMK